MIKEEYDFPKVEDYLYSNIDLLIAGFPGTEERSRFFSEIWNNRRYNFLLIKSIDMHNVQYSYIHNGVSTASAEIDLCKGVPRLLRELSVDEKNILIDLSSLDHVLIMLITKVLLLQIVPRTLFAAYIRPREYSNQFGSIGFSLCDKIMGVNSVPGFSKRESDKQTLFVFLGFEGIRLKGILESVHNISRFLPIVAFPSGGPQWYNVTMRNSMDIIENEMQDFTIIKCLSESVFDAVNLINQNHQAEEKVVLAPIGTRPHSLACAIFACQNPNTRIIYDFVVERSNRSEGIAHISIYHLSSFLST